MTKTEREDLAKLCRQRERLAKVQADVRAAEMRADFEKQLATIHSYDDNEIWKNAHDAAQAMVEEATKRVAEKCKELGIPREFAPQLSLSWYGRGENAIKSRRAELTKVAASRIDAITKTAKHTIEATSLDFQTRLLAHSLESGDARLFLESMPAAADLMPLFTTAEVQRIAGVPLSQKTDEDLFTGEAN